MDSFTQLYDVAGGIRNTLIELQKEVSIVTGQRALVKKRND